MKPPIYFQESLTNGEVYDLSIYHSFKGSDIATLGVITGQPDTPIAVPLEDVLAAVRAAGNVIWTGETARAHTEQNKKVRAEIISKLKQFRAEFDAKREKNDRCAFSQGGYVHPTK